MKTESLISVIVPVYNMEQYLSRCIESICNQTYSNIEIILIDDKSDDSSLEICCEYKKKDNRIIVIEQEHGGISMTRNTGIERSKGEYLSFIDSDDFISPEFIETLYNICINNNCEIAQCAFARTKTNGVIKDSNNDVKIFSNMEMINNIYNYSYVEYIVAWNKLYKRELFSTLRYPVGITREDEATTCIAFYNSKKIAVTNKKMYFYFENINSVTRKSYSATQLDILKSLEIRMKFFKERKLTEFYNKDAFMYLVQILKNYYMVNKYTSNNKKLKKELKEKYISSYKKTYKKGWTCHRRIVMYISKFFPVLYSSVYLKLKLLYFRYFKD